MRFLFHRKVYRRVIGPNQHLGIFIESFLAKLPSKRDSDTSCAEDGIDKYEGLGYFLFATKVRGDEIVEQRLQQFLFGLFGNNNVDIDASAVHGDYIARAFHSTGALNVTDNMGRKGCRQGREWDLGECWTQSEDLAEFSSVV